MVVVRLRRTFVFLAALFVAACLVPAQADAGVVHHRVKRAHHRCEIPCFSWKWHNSLSSPHSTNENPSDDVVDFFDDRDTRTDPTSTAVADDPTPTTESAITFPRVRAHRAADPQAARLIVFRRLAAPRPPPFL
jgi:hypothetical protein